MSFEGVDPTFQRWLDQLTDAVNIHSGYLGPTKFASHIDLGGNRITNVGPAIDASDAISSAVAEANYSAPALRPQLESNGSVPLKTMRQLNNSSQREQQSSFLNDLMSSPPSANAIYPTFASVGGGVQVTLPASLFKFADGSSFILQARTDILSLPLSFTISSISVTSNLVTVMTTAPTGLTSGMLMTVTGVTPVQFNGPFAVQTSTGGGGTLTYQDNIGTGSGSGGSVELANVYYYAVGKRTTFITLFGPFNGDTAQNRLEVNYDGFQIVAVVVLTASGGQDAQSGGGGNPIVGSPTAGTFF